MAIIIKNVILEVSLAKTTALPIKRCQGHWVGGKMTEIFLNRCDIIFKRYFCALILLSLYLSSTTLIFGCIISCMRHRILNWYKIDVDMYYIDQNKTIHYGYLWHH